MGVPGPQVAQRLPVAVPQLLTAKDPSERASRHLAHDSSTWKVEPDHRVGVLPHRPIHDDGSIVAVDDPGIGRGDRVDSGHELIRIDWLPAGEMVNGVQLDVRDTESIRNPSGEPTLAGASIPDH